jgi:hypothetical protein
MKDIINLSSDRTLERILNPEKVFKKDGSYTPEFYDIVRVVRGAFGSEMTEEDIFDHLKKPKTYVIRDATGLFGMCAYTPMTVLGEKVLFVDGIAIDPTKQGRGIFKEVTDNIREHEEFIALKTQNPRMYRALEKFCDMTYPNNALVFPDKINSLMETLAKNLDLNIDEKKVARGAYGRSLYGYETAHSIVDSLFNDKLRMNKSAGDSVLCLGIKKD